MLRARPIRTMAGATASPRPAATPWPPPTLRQNQRKCGRPIQQRGRLEVHDPPMATILSKIRCEKLVSVVAMNGPSIISAMPIATTFGRNASVASLIWVIA